MLLEYELVLVLLMLLKLLMLMLMLMLLLMAKQLRGGRIFELLGRKETRRMGKRRAVSRCNMAPMDQKYGKRRR